MAKLLCDVWKTLDMLCAAVAADKNKRISLKERFEAYDDDKTGLVSLETFLLVITRELHRLIHVTCLEANNLAEYFKVADGRIHYKQLCDVIDRSVVKLKGKPLPSDEGMQINQLMDLEEKRVALLLECIAEKLKRFKVVPGLNIAKGEGVKDTISNAEFGKVLNFLGICLTPVEFHLLARKFARDPFYVSYRGFIYTVVQIVERKKKDEGNIDCGQKSDEINVEPLSSNFRHNLAAKRQNVLTCGHNKETCCGKATELECIMDRIRMRVKFRRIDLRTHFRDWDKQNNGRILKRHFWDVFRAAGFFFSYDEISMIDNFYMTEHGMDYLSFLQDLHPQHPFVKTQVRRAPPASDCGPFHKEGLGTCCGKYAVPDTTIFKMDRRKIAANAFNKIAKCPPLNLVDIFKDQDKTNSGSITKEQLLKALGRRNMDYLLSPKELSQLSEVLKNKKGLIGYRMLENALLHADPYLI